MENFDKQITFHFEKARNIAVRELESNAREVLKQRHELDEFISSMGLAFFTLKDSDFDVHIDEESLDEYPEISPILGLLQDWDSLLGITGESMRFTANGEKITSW